MSLDSIFGCVTTGAFMDDRGVYLDGEKIALDNTRNTAYIRRTGSMELKRIGGCGGDYHYSLPLRLVGCAPNADPELFEHAVIAAVSSSANEVKYSNIDKQYIAKQEKIALEELTKFDGVAMVLIDFVESGIKTFDPGCDFEIC